MQSNSTFVTCHGCGKIQLVQEFPVSHSGLRGIRYKKYCHQCEARTEKPCAKCGVTQPVEDFCFKQGRSKKKRRDSTCRKCRAAATREWNARYSKTKLLNGNLVSAYGITLAEYNAMLESQKGLCAICNQPPEGTNQRNWRLSVDHCHACGDVRMLLCSKCNNGLGCFKDSPEFLAKAIEYLNQHKHSS